MTSEELAWVTLLPLARRTLEGVKDREGRPPMSAAFVLDIVTETERARAQEAALRTERDALARRVEALEAALSDEQTLEHRRRCPDGRHTERCDRLRAALRPASTDVPCTTCEANGIKNNPHPYGMHRHPASPDVKCQHSALFRAGGREFCGLCRTWVEPASPDVCPTHRLPVYPEHCGGCAREERAASPDGRGDKEIKP